MAIESVITTGDVGRLKIVDKTDDESLMTVEMWAQSLSPVAIPQLPWTYSINTTMSSWKSFNFANTTVWQKLGSVYVGATENFTLHLGNTGTPQLNGPTNHNIQLFGSTADTGSAALDKITIKDGNARRTVVPYVNVNGVWKPARAYVRTDQGWTY